MLLVNLNSLDHSVIEDSTLLLQKLACLGNLGGCALDHDLHDGRIPIRRHIDSGASLLAKLIQRRTTLANQGADLLLLDGHCSSH